MSHTVPESPSLPGFPADFVWGVATSAYQIEGSSRADGKGPSIWDTFCRVPGAIANGDSGDRACDHYSRFGSDIALIASLGFDAYRFSISWPRVQPDGEGSWNEAGFDFYARLLDEMEKWRIKPYLTLYHWDLPQALEDKGGWRNRRTAERFAEYAREVARRFGSRVASIATHNEPFCTAILGHEVGQFAPGMKDTKAAYLVVHNLLLSHGLASRAIRETGCRTPVGIVLNFTPAIPADPASLADRDRAGIFEDDNVWLFLSPLLGKGYPVSVRERIGKDFPETSESDLRTIAQPMDFLGVNYYFSKWISACLPASASPRANDLTAMGWEQWPEGLTKLLLMLAAEPGMPPLYITENGAAFPDERTGNRVADPRRIAYYDAHVRAVAAAMAKGVDIRGYFAWSLMDNFEWSNGYGPRFGLVYTDYDTQERIPKDSAYWFKDLISMGGK